MKIQIPTKETSIPEILFQRVPLSENIREEKRMGCSDIYFGILVGHAYYYDKSRTETITRYCHNCGCEAYAVWPRPVFDFRTTYNYDKPSFADPGWKMRVDTALRPYFERKRIQDDFTRKVEEEKKAISKQPCPVCGKELFLWKENKNVEMLEAYNRLKSYSASCDVPVAVSVNSDATALIKNDIEKLKGYLLKVIHVEKNIKSVYDRLLVLYVLSSDANREAIFAQLYPLMSERERMTQMLSELDNELCRRQDEIEKLKNSKENLAAQKVVAPIIELPQEPLEPQPPVLATPNLFNKKRVTAENAEKIAAYNQALDQYEEGIAQYPIVLEEVKQKNRLLQEEAFQKHRIKIDTLSSEITQKTEALSKYKKEAESRRKAIEEQFELLRNNTSYPAVRFKIALDEETTNAESLLKELYAQKHQLYGAEIIYRKYRDLVAVSSFYEYLLSGRCETLDGVNGCYNLYETELRANRIINQLEQISSSIEQIKDNQYMLYSQLNDINTELSVLNTSTVTMLQTIQSAAGASFEQSSIIAHNTAVAAYYAKINAEIASSTRYIRMICW